MSLSRYFLHTGRALSRLVLAIFSPVSGATDPNMSVSAWAGMKRKAGKDTLTVKLISAITNIFERNHIEKSANSYIEYVPDINSVESELVDSKNNKR